MNTFKTGDIFIGVKAEQHLRDVVRHVIESDDKSTLELTPVGRKDWIAGQRFSAPMNVGEMAQHCREVYLQLISLGSQQRIRTENIRMYAIQLHVPVFVDSSGAALDPADLAAESGLWDGDDEASGTAPFAADADADADGDKDEAEGTSHMAGGPAVCPVCGRTVHSFNLHRNTHGQVVGCFLCGGHGRRF